MKTKSALKNKHNQRVAQYRARADKERLELMVTPELAQRFRHLPGMGDRTNAQKLEALCDLWLKQTRPEQEPEPEAKEPELPEINNSALIADTGIEIPAGPDLAQIERQLDGIDQELAEDEARDAAPELSEAEVKGELDGLRHKLEKDVRDLARYLDEKWPRRVDTQQSRVAAVWGRVLREETALQDAMEQIAAHSPKLAELMISGKALRYVTPRDITALLTLPQADQLLVLMYLMNYDSSENARKHLGELGERFHQAWLQQPERTPQSWKLKPAPRKSKSLSSPPADDEEYRREMLRTIEKLYQRLYAKAGKPGNTKAAKARKNIPVIANLRMGPYHKLYQLLVADLLPISESELQTLSGFGEAEQRQALWTLMQSRTQALLAD